MKRAEKGKVYLVGAGPGDPDLLTVRAAALIQSADFVFHDDLVAPAILELAHADATIQNVGKRCGSKSVTQDDINELLIHNARAGHRVVRLKAALDTENVRSPSRMSRSGRTLSTWSSCRPLGKARSSARNSGSQRRPGQPMS